MQMVDPTVTPELTYLDGWTVYLIAFLVIIAVFLVQKYVYLIDVQLSKFSKKPLIVPSKPWALWFALFIGMFILFYNFFSQDGLEKVPGLWGWPEWIIFICTINVILILGAESIRQFGWNIGLIRILIYLILMAGFFYASFFVGFFLLALIALAMLIYFIRYWRKIMVIK